jgi:co-chaperonin GroES (HSP10)
MSNLIEHFFPEVKHGFTPVGNQLLIQGQFVPKKSTGGIYIPEKSRKEESYNITIGRIVAMGDLAFKNKDTLEDWKEGRWANVGDLVFIPRTGHIITKYIGDEEYRFVLISDIETLCKIEDLDGLNQFKL